ncbi:guanine nucleotide exchange factor DBS [Callorhinchus milii]|uniref:guanine nucleotide exchange factor DBS n=1 Tax=Callorhinchus milii TaxID=7868 RepID=UPI001C3FF364|nr:guanine nucleotide exchange factor DBS [Callorhinchus milii]
MSWRRGADFQKFLSPPDLPEDRVLYSGAAIIPGGFDHQGSPLVIVPRAQQSKLVSDLKSADIVKLFKYFLHHLSESQTRNCLISIVADLRCATLDVVSSIINSLLQVQCQFGGIVDTFYALQPQKKGIKKCLLKSLGLGRSKPFSEPPFKYVLLNEVFELFNYIDRSQLTSDLGGYLVYQHAAWVHFRKDIDGFICEYCRVMQRFPGLLALLQELSLQSLPAGAEEFQWLPHELQELYTQGRRDLGIDELLRRCETIVEKLKNPKADPHFLAMAGTAVFAQTLDEMYERNERIRAAVDKVELLWQQALSRAQLLLKDFQCKQKAQQIIDLIIEEGLGNVRAYKVEIANNFSQAEMLKLKYEDAIYKPAMELVVESEKVLHALGVLTEQGLGRDEDLWEKLNRLKETLNIAVDMPYKTLKAVCDFNYMFEKKVPCSEWCNTKLLHVTSS